MKQETTQLVSVWIVTAIMLLSLAGWSVSAETSPISLSTAIAAGGRRNATQPITGADRKRLDITIINIGESELEDVSVNFALYGDNNPARSLQKLGAGSRVLRLGSNDAKMILVETATTPATSQPASTNELRETMIVPEGQEFSGYTVQVLQGTKLLAEAYDPACLKDGNCLPAYIAPNAPPPAATAQPASAAAKHKHHGKKKDHDKKKPKSGKG
jgi:hypothetical protein